jgi:hypothetical protein
MFVRATTDAATPDYVQPRDRIATFDNDGTLWSEQPYYFQFAFAIDQIRSFLSNDRENASRLCETVMPASRQCDSWSATRPSQRLGGPTRRENDNIAGFRSSG